MFMNLSSQMMKTIQHMYQHIYNTRMQWQQLGFNVGQNVDVKDLMKKWVNGEILFIRGEEIYVHYSGWSSRFDEYVPLSSGRIHAQWQPGQQLQLNHRVDSYHPFTGWLEARVIQIGEGSNTKVKVHYFNYHPKYDRWVDPNNREEIDIIGSRSKAYGIGKSRLKKKTVTKLSELAKKALVAKIQNMVQQLKQADFQVHTIEGDGNCLFRAVSHQLYGKQDHHREIRLLCMDYILKQAPFFQDYVTEDLSSYVQRKSQNGQWGDDVEIEALSEIYGRPIQIYATSARPLRTFHQDRTRQIEPLRLAYVGLCHYNSVKHRNRNELGLLQGSFGDYEQMFLASYSQQSQETAAEVNRYRSFFSHTNALDSALAESLEAAESTEEVSEQELLSFEKKEVNEAIQISEAEDIIAEIEKAELIQLQHKHEQQQLQEEIRRIEERQMELAKELSSKLPKQQDRPHWFHQLLSQGFPEQSILFAIEINGYDPESVQNFLFDNM